MSIVLVGLSHHTSPVELRERLHFSEQNLPSALLHIRKKIDGGAVILSTCNRVELYVNNSEHPAALAEHVRDFLGEFTDVPEAEFRPHLYEHADKAAVGHLFRVASSLDSMVVGEQQILGQVHDAYLAAHSEQATDKIISALFQKAFAVAKEVRTKTTIGGGKVSVGSVAVDLAVSIFMNLSDKTVMIIGSGEMGELALKSLVSRGVKNVLLVNRTVEKAQELADRFHGEPIPLTELGRNLHRADIVITSTGSSEYILKAGDFAGALRQRSQAPMFVIDIAVPRNVEPAANDLDNVYLYDMDDLQQIAEQNLEKRRQELAVCIEIVERRSHQFWDWVQGLIAEPTILSMSTELHTIRERELEKTLASLPDLTTKQKEEVEYLTKRIVNAIMQRPVTQLKREVIQEDPHRVLHLVKRLFGLELK